MIKVMLSTELEQIAPYVDMRVMSHLEYGQINRFECHDQLNLMSFDYYDIQNLQLQPAQIIIVFTKEHLFFLCEGENSLQQVNALLTHEGRNDRVLFNFFVELLKGDIEYLDDMEERITETEDKLLADSRKSNINEIRSLRHSLLRLKKYYEQLNQIFEGLQENENGLISKEDFRFFRILNNKINRLFASVLSLRDYVTQVREAYQAQIDLEQNKLMRIFTVITFIFMPLTFIVGWYGMNLQMPEYAWPYAYPLIIVISIVVLALCIVYFKRKKWF